MNRNLRESLSGGRNIPAISQFRRGGSNHNNISQNGFARESDENLDLFSKIRRSFPLASSDELPDVSAKLGRLSVGSKPAPRGKGDDLLSSAEGGKNDYDWLLTPPGTPLGNDSHSSLAAPKLTSSARASSASKASRLSVSQSETSYHSSRPARSSSVTRPSVSTSQYSSFTSGRSPSSILNTSSASVSSYIRPSSPSSRSSSSARPSTPTRTSSASRASTPSRIRPGSSSSSMDKARPSLSSRPSTPTSRPQLSANSPNIIASRPNSRPSTPTRRSPSTSVSATPGSNISSGRAASNGRSAPSLSRPSSPGPRVRTTPQQPIVLPDFTLDTPPNLRTTLPDRPISAGRSRPGTGGSTAKASPEPKGPITRRNSSPIVTRGRISETQGNGRFGGNRQHLTDAPEPRRISNVSEVTSRRTVRTSSTAVTDNNNNGLGRSFSKSSLDMAIRHMDIRSGKTNGCALSTTTLFPQSIRPASSKIQPIRSGNNHSESISSNGTENGNEANEGRRLMGKLSDMDMYESSRYDALLLKEDVKNTNWLHSIDDRSPDHGLIFDNGGFELLPEPFAPL
ncbi:PREDICTED: serine/arginine repetitive matrix protein 2-like [Camelina sativa]|uniref:Serine/arginine repetitive matrix protein 2-like n=1 Tax=Camelina sativa TaxID=90675 RepID=A0ABM0W1S7_CAMSA|nr:PREDICTED: serine/arginine repetitive matrix protein 2-like [Camelina sativa]